MLPYIVTVLGAYLIGCSNMALYLSRRKGVDLRAGGSKNLGASNAFALMGWKAGVLVAVHDIGKAVLAVELSRWIFPAVPLLGFIAGVACVLGHMFPFYLRFKGGKGFASYLGMILAINWKFALCILAAVVILTVLTDYIVVGTVTSVVSFPIYTAIRSGWIPLPTCSGLFFTKASREDETVFPTGLFYLVLISPCIFRARRRRAPFPCRSRCGQSSRGA